MKKNLLFAIICVLGFLGNLNAQKEITIGEGDTYSMDLPFKDHFCYSVSQQIYTAAELSKIDMEKGPAAIESIAFKSATDNLNESYIKVYMMNVSKQSFADGTEWVELSAEDKVYEGYLTTTGKDNWSNMVLTTPFLYTGTNILLCVSSYNEDQSAYETQDYFYTYSPSSENNVSCSIQSSDSRIEPYNVTSDMKENATVSTEKNQIQMVYSQNTKSDINTNFKSIDLGDIASNDEYWTEKEAVSAVVTAASVYSKIESVTCSDPFFVLPDNIDYTKTPVKFVVSYDKNSSAGEKTAEITIANSDGEEAVIPIRATVYDVVKPDVFELAQEVTFDEGSFTDKPDFATLHDDYLLPNESLKSIAPDAVYSLTIEKDTMVMVNVDGTNAKIALYAEDFGGKEGPMADNAFLNDEEKILSTTFLYNFDDGNLDNFTVEDYDKFQEYTWKIENNCLTSYSFMTWGEYGGDDYGYMNEADERIITKEAYPITPNSVLTLNVDRHNNGTFMNLYVEVTKDGETFEEVEWIEVKPNYYDDPENAAMGGYEPKRRVNIGAKLSSLGLDYGEYRIALHHQSNGAGQITVDNFVLTERSNVIPAGNYYLVVAAEDAFSVTVSLDKIPDDNNIDPDTPTKPESPVVTATDITASSVTLKWNPVNGATSYNVYQNAQVIKTELTETTYIVEGLEENTNYSFTVTAVNIVGESIHSEEVFVKTLKHDGVSENETTFNIYPNPVENELFLATELNVEEVMIYDIYGRQQAVNTQLSAVSSLDVSDLSSGVYFVKVVTDAGETVKRFVKK